MILPNIACLEDAGEAMVWGEGNVVDN